MRRGRETGAAAVAVIVAGLTAWWMWRPGPAPVDSSEVGRAGAGRLPAPAGDVAEAALVTGAPARAGDAESGRARLLAAVDRLWDEPSEGRSPAHAVEVRLRRFLLRGAAFRNAKFGDVIDHLRERMGALGADDLAAAVGELAGSASRGVVNLTTSQPLSAWAFLNVAAAQAGVAVEVDDDGRLVVRPVAGVDDLADPRAVPVAGWALASWMREAGFAEDALAIESADDPFGDPEAARGRPSPEGLRAFLETFGVALPEGGWVDFDPVSGHLAVHGSARDAAIVAAVAGLADTTGWPQIYLTSKLVGLDEAGPIADQVLTAGDVDALLAMLNEEADVELLTMPSIVTRPGQPATVEIVDEVAVADSAGVPGVETRGIRFHFTPSVEGLQDVHLAGSIDLSGTGGEGSAVGELLGVVRAGSDGQWAAVDAPVGVAGDRQVTEFETVVRGGETAALMAFDDGAGGRVLALISARLIDPAGQPFPFDPPSHPIQRQAREGDGDAR